MDKTGNIPLRSEEIGYSAGEMINCGKCGKPNPPNRANCLYCGTGLQLPESARDSVKLNLRQLESWEKGFNLILAGTETALNDPLPAGLADPLPISSETLTGILASGIALPIARIESRADAEILVERFAAHGVKTAIISDDELAPDKPPTRLRSVEFSEGGMTVHNFNNDERAAIDEDELRVIVFGSVYESKTAVREKKKRKSTEVIDESQTTRDEPVIDLYTFGNRTGFRIYISGFDFSCLGAGKSLLAAENMRGLAEKMRRHFPLAAYINNYVQFQDVLDAVWPAESRRDSLGFQQSIFAGRSSENLTTVNNHLQFTKFSRLQSHLI